MSTTDWNEVDAIFHAALEAPSDARPAVLDRLCAGRPEIRAEVESLLEAHASSTGFLHGPGPLDLLAGHAQVGVGAVLGAYRLVEEIGRGGMGTVFLGERTDGSFSHRVAIKVMRAPIADRDAARRFQVERQILASLRHPGIVTLIDGGTAPGGQPYLVMEHVEGQPISQWLRERQSPLEVRLRLFRQVCSAVHVAHQHGVVHRDIKPANIVVTGDGVPKVLDFGVAKLLERPGSDVTLTGLLPGPLTPNYASPEQLRGVGVTTASDVYSLGVLLFECVAGARPYETTGRPVDEVLRQVLDSPVARPSVVAERAVADGERLPYPPRRLRGDIDAIVQKAMHLDPAHRYASAEELSDDVARWLGGKPVLAREPSFAYTARKLAARHRVAAVAVVAAVVGVLAALGVALWQRQVAVRERAAAVQRFDEVRGLTTALIFKLHDAVAKLPGSTEARKMIVAEALGYLDRLAASSERDDVRMELALGYKQVGRVQGDPQSANLGEREPALDSFRRALAIFESLTDSPTLGAKALFEVSQTSRLVSQTLSVLGRHDESKAASRAALSAAETLLARSPDNDEARRLVASGHFAIALSETDRPTKLKHWLASEQGFEALLADEPDDPDRMRNVALVNKYLGGHLQVDGENAEAERRYRRALELDERRLRSDPNSRTVQFDLAIDLANMGSVLARLDRDDESLAYYARSVSMRERLVESDPKDAQAQQVLARGLVSAARLRYEMGDRDGAARDARRLLDVARRLPNANETGVRRITAQGLIVLATVDADERRQASACERYRLAFGFVDREQQAALEPSERRWIERLESKLAGCGALAAPPARAAGGRAP
ncbi:MAG: serine/threonine-protein kinase [Vicinamibacterales bacterium]|nr:serine/threonine-protein kinase [Vicinamibacterales bacterium]